MPGLPPTHSYTFPTSPLLTRTCCFECAILGRLGNASLKVVWVDLWDYSKMRSWEGPTEHCEAERRD